MSTLSALVQSASLPTPTSAEGRHYPRYPAKLDALSRSVELASMSWGATVNNLSAKGLGLRLCFPFKPGTYIAVDLLGMRFLRTLLARVIHSTERGDGSWLIGCELAECLTDDEVAVLADEFGDTFLSGSI